jgi:glucose/arabinose dehydrogenase
MAQPIRSLSGIPVEICTRVLRASRGVLSVAAISVAAAWANPYPAGTVCNGLPRVPVQTPPGTCLQVVQSGLKFPRGVVVLPDGAVMVAEMGGWSPGKGRLSRFAQQGGVWQRSTVLEGLDRPHQVRLGPDGKLYLGLAGGVARLERDALQWVVGRTSGVTGPAGSGLHPLTNFLFDRERNLIVNNGSFSDHCEGAKGEKPDPALACPEAEQNPPRAALLHYTMRWPEGKAAAPTVLARGLRNSRALAVHASGTLIQGENSRDAINRNNKALDDAKLPHDELNLIVAGQHYGWPQCYDNNAVAPEYAATPDACRQRTRPLVLLTPHAAPLGLTYAPVSKSGESAKTPMERAFSGMLVVPYHGYRAGAQRIVGFRIDARGVPQGSPVNLVHGWEMDVKAKKPMGAPVEVAFDAQGNLWITEDRNGTLLRLVSEQK